MKKLLATALILSLAACDNAKQAYSTSKDQVASAATVAGEKIAEAKNAAQDKIENQMKEYAKEAAKQAVEEQYNDAVRSYTPQALQPHLLTGNDPIHEGAAESESQGQ